MQSRNDELGFRELRVATEQGDRAVFRNSPVDVVGISLEAWSVKGQFEGGALLSEGADKANGNDQRKKMFHDSAVGVTSKDNREFHGIAGYLIVKRSWKASMSLIVARL